MAEGWSPIESDPAVMSEMLEGLGAKGLQVEELYSLEKEALKQLDPVYGLIFLFKWRPEEHDNREVDNEAAHQIYFANQSINNACATQALLSVVLNAESVDLGEELSNLKDFSRGLPPALRGEALSNSETIRKVHNSFARPEPIVEDQSAKPGEGDDTFHFIAYVPVQGKLYELDGLKEGPIKLADLSEQGEWLDKVIPAIQSRIERHASNEIRFSLMAVCKDRRQVAREKAEQARQERDRLQSLLQSGDSLPEGFTDTNAVRARVSELDDEMSTMSEQVQAEEEKRLSWRKENVRRKHNYIPFIFNFLKLLADKGELGQLVEKAKKKRGQQQ